jgi:hypothetical protein
VHEKFLRAFFKSQSQKTKKIMPSHVQILADWHKSPREHFCIVCMKNFCAHFSNLNPRKQNITHGQHSTKNSTQNPTCTPSKPTATHYPADDSTLPQHAACQHRRTPDGLTLVQYIQARPDGPCQSIGVLTMYRQQRQELQDELAHWGPRVRVLTVDGAQGLEFDLVVLSTVCTRYSMFLDDGPRVNVAISRARFALVVVGHRGTLLRTRFLRHVARNGAVVADAADVA